VVSGKPILVVDDDKDIRESLAEILSEAGYEVRCFANGADALAFLEKDANASLILLDLMMPVMNGWTFREKQSRDGRLASIPVFTMSAVADLAPPPLPRAPSFRKPLNVERLLAGIAERVH
jgi:CheY-like chemotaxis protein